MLLTFQETSRRLGGRSLSSLYRDVKAGRLPEPVAIGGRRYFREADLAHLTGEGQG